MKNWVGVLDICNFHSISGKIHILTHIFQRGWFNHINEKNNGRSLLYHSSQAPWFCCWRDWGIPLVSGWVKQLESEVWFFKGRDPGKLHPRRLTWNLRKHPWKRKIIFQTIIFRFYVNLWGCSCTPWKKSHGDQMEVDGSDDFPFLCSVSFRWTHANFLPSRDPLRLLHLLIKRVDVGRFHTRLVIWMSTFMWYLDMLQGSNKYTVYSRYSSI